MQTLHQRTDPFISVIVADDHPLITQAMCSILGTMGEVKVVASCSNGEELVAAAAQLRPDVVVLDLAMPRMGGGEAARRIADIDPSIRIIVCTGISAGARLREVLTIGVAGIVTKDAAVQELPLAIRHAIRGREYYSSSIIELLSAMRRSIMDTQSAFRLSRREEQILYRILKGVPKRRVCEQLSIAASTYATHRKNIMRKLGVHSVQDLVRVAMKYRIVP
jgi:DNA-binding NarL/FixJ family response regulator